MISSEHELWKVANYYGEVDDWIPYAEDLIKRWSSLASSEIKFTSSFEISLAACLLKDGLLPNSACLALAEVLLKAMSEADKKKYTLNSLFISPGRPGRKENRTATFIRRREVLQLIKEGKTATEAYKTVAEKHFKSADTIRRDYERFIKKNPKYK